jgi:hypothetical protein
MQNHEQKKKVKKSEKPRFYVQKKLFFEHHAIQPLGIFSHMAACRSSLENTGKNELNAYFQQKLAKGSYGVRIGRAWCSQKACEICSSLIQKKKLKKNYFSSHKLPKQRSTSFWSQGILGVKHFYSIEFHIQQVTWARAHRW